MYVCRHTLIYTHTHMYVTTIIKEKEDINLRVGDTGRQLGGAAGRKGSGSDKFLFQFFFSKHKKWKESIEVGLEKEISN